MNQPVVELELHDTGALGAARARPARSRSGTRALRRCRTARRRRSSSGSLLVSMLVVQADVVDVAVRLRVVGIDRERLLPHEQRTVEVACAVAVQALARSADRCRTAQPRAH